MISTTSNFDEEERKHGQSKVRYGDNGETTDTINTRPGKEGLIRDKMDLAGRPHPRGDWKEPPGWHEVGPTELRKLGIDPALLEDKKPASTRRSSVTTTGATSCPTREPISAI